MPTIPLYQGGQIPANRTGVMVPAVAQGVTAGPAVGNALVQIGGLGSQIAEKMAQANDTRQFMEAEGLMQQHAKEQQLFQQQTPDQDQWLPAWEKRQQQMADAFQKMSLTKQGRMTLDRGFNRWSSGQTIDIQGQAFKQSVGRAKTAVLNRATEAAQAGDARGIDGAIAMLPQDFTTPEEREDLRLQLHGTALNVQRDQVKNSVAAAILNNQPETAKAWLDKGLQSGALTKEQHAAQMADVDHAAEVNSLVTIANDDPRRAMELAIAGEQAKRISGPERVRIVDAAQSRLDGLRSDAVKSYTDQIKMGVADKNAFADKILKDSNIETVDKANLSRFLDVGPVNDPVAYAKLYAEAKTFEGDEGSPEYARLLSRADMALDGEHKSGVVQALGEAVKAPKNAQSRAKNAIFSQMSDDLQAGLFGSLNGKLADLKTSLDPKMRAEVDAIKAEVYANHENWLGWDGQPKTDEEKEIESRKTWWQRNNQHPAKGETFDNHVVDDEAAKRMASQRAWDAMASLEKWQADNPKATPQELRSQYESYLVKQRAAGSVSPLLPAIEVPTVKVDLKELLKRHASNP